MKKNSFLVGLLTATTAMLLFLLLAGNSPQDTIDNDRYQLITGEYDFVNTSGVVKHIHAPMKIDTQTGNTWFYLEQFDQAAFNLSWKSTR